MERTGGGAARIPGASRASGQRRRLEILAAALRIIARDGLRAVSHRAVAAEAGVPLAATTYYFRDLEDLITESFLHWSGSQERVVGEFHAAALGLLDSAGPERGAPGRLVEELAAAAAAYVIDQARSHRPDRVLEFAFLHEAARMPKLRAVVHDRQLADLAALEQFHAALGSAEPAVDAQISYSLLLGLEKSALLADPEDTRLESVRSVLAHYLRSVLERAKATPAAPAGNGSR